MLPDVHKQAWRADRAEDHAAIRGFLFGAAAGAAFWALLVTAFLVGTS